MTFKTIAIAALLFIGFHLLLFSYLRRRIAVAKALAAQKAKDDNV
jgi:hypothetical protein